MESKSALAPQESKKAKEHWSRHPLVLVIVPIVIVNIGGIFAAISYVTVANIPLFIILWAVGAILSFIAGAAFPIYVIFALFSKEARETGYIRFLLSIYWSFPMGIYLLIQDRMKKE